MFWDKLPVVLRMAYVVWGSFAGVPGMNYDPGRYLICGIR